MIISLIYCYLLLKKLLEVAFATSLIFLKKNVSVFGFVVGIYFKSRPVFELLS